MPFECLEFILGLRQLAVRSEDTVLEIIAKWTQQQSIRPNENELEDLLSCVRWDFITVKSLVSSISNYSALKEYIVYRRVFKEELENKIMLKHARHKPRACYKQEAKESFKGPKDYIEALAEVLLDIDIVQVPQKNDEVLNEMYNSINQQENEIKQLKTKYSSLVETQEITSTPIVTKLGKTEDGFYRVPSRLRNFSAGRKVSFSPLSTKNNKTGNLLENLLKKLKH